jgi:CDP-4-dehydro-6-deoxyglucose reductase
MPAHRISWPRAGAKFEAQPGERLLDAALRAGVALPHDCRGGACGRCRVQLTHGRVDYDDWPLALSEEEASVGQALACQARVRSDLVFDAEQPLAPRAPQITLSRVLARAPLAPGVTQLRLQVPAELVDPWHPGQHLDILLPDGRRRSFSIANAYAAPGSARQASGGEIELHIRHIPGGLFTQCRLHALQAGEALPIELPLGGLRWHAEDDRPVLMVATGTGVAPFKAMLEAMELAGDAPPVTLYWGLREPADLYLEDCTARWSRSLFEFSLVPVLSRAGPGWAGRRGHAQHALLHDQPDLAGFAIYLCGNPAMVRDAREAFLARGAEPRHLYSDSFIFQHDALDPERPADGRQAA